MLVRDYGINMPWLIEDLAGTINGTNRDFTISHVPQAGSLIVVQQGKKLEAVVSQPDQLQVAYALSGTNLTLGLAPLIGQTVPWCRYFY
jgi:hypothetical protein